MEENKTTFASIDEYILQFPQDVQAILQTLRKTIQEAAPDAKEKISYQMPAFTLNNRILIYFAAYKKHIGLYTIVSALEEFKHELSEYKVSKGTIQFPLEKPIPYALISRIVKLKADENTKNAKDKLNKGK